jgi:hypothetical protein
VHLVSEEDVAATLEVFDDATVLAFVEVVEVAMRLGIGHTMADGEVLDIFLLDFGSDLRRVVVEGAEISFGDSLVHERLES